MSDCRFILDNVSDMSAQSGSLVTGSDAIDISGAQMIKGADGWQLLVKTVDPAQQNPRLSVSVALYLDVDGRMDNNATAGPRLGADTVYGIVSGKDGWKITRETMNVVENGFKTASTQATFSVASDGYTINIPYSEVAKDTPAYWKAGVAEGDASRLTIDYVPDIGLSCTPSMAPKNGLADLAVRTKTVLDSGLRDILVVAAVVIAAAIVVFLKWKKNRKNKV
jgi:hypothetical protein